MVTKIFAILHAYWHTRKQRWPLYCFPTREELFLSAPIIFARCVGTWIGA